MVTITNAQQTQILKLIAGMFNAAPGANYLSEFSTLIAGGVSIAQLADSLAATSAFTSGVMGGKVTADAQVQQLMGHFGMAYATTPTTGTAAAGAQAWFAAQIAAQRGFGAIVYEAATALSDPTWLAANPLYSDAVMCLNNKAAVSAYYSTVLAQSSTDLASLQRVIAAVTASTPVATDADLVAAIAAGGGSSGQNFVLTSATNPFNGGGGNDTFTADLVNEGGIANVQTLNNNDSLDGGAGIDTLIATLNTNVTPTSLKNIEIIHVSNADTLAHTLTLSNADAVTTLKTSNNSGAIVFSTLPTKLSGGLEITNNAQNVTLTSTAAALVGTTDELAVKLQSVTAGILSVDTVSDTNGYETLTINSTGSVANTLTELNDGSATTLATLVITGDKDFTLSNSLAAEIKTIDAAGFTGELSLTLTNAAVLNVTGGTAGDTFILGNTFVGAENATATNRDTLNGGAGRDTLSITSANAVAATTTTQTTVSNIEIIKISDGVAGSIDLTKFSGADTLVFTNATVGAHTFTFSNNNTLEFTSGDSGDNTRSFNIFGTGTADSLTFKTVAGTDLGTATQVLDGIETLNFNTGTTAGSAVELGGAINFVPTPGSSSKLIFSGINSIDINASNLTVSEVDASGLSGDAVLDMGIATLQSAANVTGSSNNDVINGSTGADVLIAGAGNDTLTGLAGDDVIDISGGGSNTLIFANTGAGNGKDTLIGFNAGSVTGSYDILGLNAFLGTVPGTLTAAASLTGAATVANDTLQIVKFTTAIANKNYAGADFADLFGAGKVFSTTIADNALAVIVVQGSDQTQILYVDEALDNANDLTVVASDVVVVGVLNGVTNADTFVAANFA